MIKKLEIPAVWDRPMPEGLVDWMKLEAQKEFALHSVLPRDPEHRKKTLKKLADAMRLKVNRDLPLNVEVTGSVCRNGYRIDKVYFQADESRYVTGCLYVPDGDGPFPAVLNLHGHWPEGHLAENVQNRGHILARHGFVCLSIDVFGSGERATTHGDFEPHGGPRGTLLNNFGETLIAIQIADNMRAVDYLCSLPFVDAANLGVTGASGGGNQTMYIMAFDERLKAGISVCSVGTYESYIMGSNCICETIPGGLAVCEEAGVVACIAPRKFMMISGLFDEYSTFVPAEMTRTWQSARKYFRYCGVENNLQYRILPTRHGYSQLALSEMLGYFNRHLKGIGFGDPVPVSMEIDYLTPEEAMVFPRGKRPAHVTGILEYCSRLSARTAKERRNLSAEERRAGLEKCLNSCPVTVIRYTAESAGEFWQRVVLETDDGFVIPGLLHPSANGRWSVMSATFGKSELADRPYLAEKTECGDGLLLIDLRASGENGAEYGNPTLWDFHNTGRSLFWTGRTMLGEWVRDYTAAANWLKKTFNASAVTLYGYQDAAVAALLATALYPDCTEAVFLDAMPRSLDWSNVSGGERIPSLALCVTDILKYGDIDDFKQMAENKR